MLKEKELYIFFSLIIITIIHYFTNVSKKNYTRKNEIEKPLS